MRLRGGEVRGKLTLSWGQKKYPAKPDISWWAIEDSNLSPPQRQ